MQITQIDFLKKRNKCISSFIRNTSCSSGWLRLMVQIIFGTLIVSSFILIVLMAISSSYRGLKPAPRCITTNCRVICNEAPFYGQYEDDIINAASEIDPNCESIALQLNWPTFENSQIPENWLSRIRSNVRELAIIGGNTKQIQPYAFMSPLSNNLKTLILEKIEINFWDTDMLIGLSRLKKLFIKDCYLTDIRQNALRIVDDSLEYLDIKASYDFNPVNFTGSAQLNALNVVDFSLNNFDNILGYASFSQLKYCKILFLNSCKITVLKPGTFDHLESIEMLYLNDNKLVTIPVGLFDKLVLLRPRIALQENHWHCDCSTSDLRTISQKGLLIIDPICRFPDSAYGMTFSDFDGYCNKINNQEIADDSNENKYSPPCKNISKVVYMNGACADKNSSDDSDLKVISAGVQKCFLNRINKNDLKYISIKKENAVTSPAWINPVFSLKSDPYSMIEMESKAQPGFGLLWYQSLCLNEVYCVNTIPNFLKVFNIDSSMRYTFCPFSLSNGTIINHKCLSYNFFKTSSSDTSKYRELILYICIALGCLLCGAFFVYALIQRNPTLLKGNKRVVFVKHKSIEALILPPQLPLRKKFTNEPNITRNQAVEKNKIFLLPGNSDKLSPNNFIRSISTRSSESNDASYISALQPTEEQLSEWRSNQIIKQFDKSTSNTDTSSFSSIYDQDSLPYYSFHTSERIYEVPKQY